MATCRDVRWHPGGFPRIAWPLLLAAVSAAWTSEAAGLKLFPPRRPVPETAGRSAATQSVQGTYRERCAAAKTSLQKQSLARELIEEANRPGRAPADQYALLRAAADMAAAAGDPPTVCAAIDEMAERFEIDDLGLRSSLLAKTAPAVAFPLQQDGLVHLAKVCAAGALLRDNRAVYRQAEALMVGAAEKSGNPQLIEQARASRAVFSRVAAGQDPQGRARLTGDMLRRHLVARQWFHASLYAESAAGSSEPLALEAAAAYYEAAHEWDKAEACLRKWSSLQPSCPSFGAWYFFCRRTGHGDSATASRGLRQHLQRDEAEFRQQGAKREEELKEPAPTYPGPPWADCIWPRCRWKRWQGMLSLLEGRPAEAAAAFQKAFVLGHEPYTGLLAALAADHAQQPALRDSLLGQVQVSGYRWRPGYGESWPFLGRGPIYSLGHVDSRPFAPMIVLAGLFAQDLAEGGKGQITPATVAALCSSADCRQADLLALLGLYLEAHAQEAIAVECWKQAMGCSLNPSTPGRTIAGARLLAHKVRQESYRDLVLRRPEAERGRWDREGVLPETGSADELETICQYEARLFDPVMPAEEVDRLLAGLEGAGSAARLQTVGRLIREGQGHQERLAAFAAKSKDVEVRQACAEVVAALDTAYQTGAMACSLKALQARHFEELWPQYWQRFRKDPHDLRAVAMLMMSDQNTAFAAISKADRLDGLRFLLLRTREVRCDRFAATHLSQYTSAEVQSVLPDVFPEAGGHRLVGHLLRNKATVKTHESRHAKTVPFELIISDVVFVFRYESRSRHRAINCAAIELVSSRYEGHSVYGYRPVDRVTIEMTRDIACPLPELKLTFGQASKWNGAYRPAAWWTDPYVPRRYRWVLLPEKRTEYGEPAPEVVREDDAMWAGASPLAPRTEATRSKPLGPDAPCLVVLAPKLPAEATERARAAAELACDRLAQEVELGGIARVLNRTQLDRVLWERELAGGPSRTMLSYDAMARLEIDRGVSAAQSRLRVIDLSTGNVLGEREFGWPIQEADVPAVLDLCRTALAGVTRGEKAKRLKVRLVGLEDAATAARMRPLAGRLHEAFRKALAASPGVLSVQHIEAGSANEESLLLAMGLSRLPGGRQFVPQADVTITLRVTESEGVGKTFAETPVEIGVRLGQAAQKEDAWQSTPGTVKEFDAAVGRAWDKLAGSLAGTTPAAAKAVDEMALRRRQAEAELQAAAAVDPHLGREGCAMKQMAHLEAALKIDPTLEPAAYQLIASLREVAHARRDTAGGVEFQRRLVKEGANYLERFPGDWQRRATVLVAMSGAIVVTPLGSLERQDSLIRMTPELHDVLDAAKQALENSVSGDIRGSVPRAAATFLPIVYRGMKMSGTPPTQRREWLADLLRQWEQQARQLDKLDAAGRKHYLNGGQYVRMAAAEVALGDGQAALAKALLARMLEQWSRRKRPVESASRERARKIVAALDDRVALADFDRRYPRTSPASAAIHWPRFSVYEGQPDPRAPQVDIQYFTKDYGGPSQLVPLAEGGGRLYVFVKAEERRVGYVSLDAQGRPQGRPVPVESNPSVRTWSTLTLLDPPNCQGLLDVLCARHFEDRLYLGTRDSGLLCYDPKAGQWRIYGPDEGLPDWRVATAFPIGDGLFFCSGNFDQYTLDVRSGEVKLLRRGESLQRRTLSDAFGRVWHDGQRLAGLTPDGLWKDLLGHQPEYTELPPAAARRRAQDAASRQYVAQYAAETAGRRFFLWPDGLAEYDAQGQELRTWHAAPKIDPKTGSATSAVAIETPIPPGGGHGGVRRGAAVFR